MNRVHMPGQIPQRGGRQGSIKGPFAAERIIVALVNSSTDHLILIQAHAGA